MTSNARQFPRYATQAAVELRLADTTVRGRSTNISRGGLCAVVDAHVPSGARVVVSLALVFAEDTFSEPLELPARVVWCTKFAGNQHQLGTQFLPLDEEQQQFLAMFLRYLEEGEAAKQADEVVGHVEDDDPFA